MMLSSKPEARPHAARGGASCHGRAVFGLLVLLAVAGALVLGSSGGRLLAQDDAKPAKDVDESSLGRFKNFAVPEYYDPPNQNQMKSLLRGAEAQPQANGEVIIKGVQLETYNTNGKAMMIVRAPDCTYNQGDQTASSTNHIEASSGDGKLFIEGDGFRFEQTNSVFVISNKVHTLIRQDTETNTASAAP